MDLNFQVLQPTGVSDADMDCSGMSLTVSLKMMVFALRAFCFELLIASSTVNLLYSP